MRRPLLAALLACVLPLSALAALEAEEVELKVTIEGRQKQMEAQLRTWIEHNTGSWNLQGLEAFAAGLVEPLEQLGFQVEVEPGVELDIPGREGARTGPTVIARRSSAGSGPPRFLLVGHYDTVFEPGSGFESFEVPDAAISRAVGPGVADMKGGLVVLLFTLRALAESGELDNADWTVILNGDEELGSLGSRATIEKEARTAHYGFVFEASFDRTMVRSRRGLGQFHLAVRGVAAHAGNAHERGRSAVRELAHKVIEIEALTDYERGLTLNVGTLSGGRKRNIIPDHAEAWVDVRFDDPELGDWVRGALERVSESTFIDGTETRLWGTLHRPPKVETDEVRALLDRHARVAVDLGLAVPERVHSGGGTDGSLMGAVGLPTLDSMGVVGGNAHTEQEYAALDSLSERVVIAAVLLRRLVREALEVQQELLGN